MRVSFLTICVALPVCMIFLLWPKQRHQTSILLPPVALPAYNTNQVRQPKIVGHHQVTKILQKMAALVLSP